jgi:GT2 family glycosyltransferase
MFKVCAIVVTYNRLEILKENISKILSQITAVDQIIIVDNGSSDYTPAYLRSKELGEVIPICLERNLGFGKGLRVGIEFAKENYKPDFYWLLDDDSFPESGLLDFLLSQAFKINRSGVFGLSGYIHSKGIPKRPIEPSGRFSEVDFVLVDNALISREVIEKAGSISGDFFMMCEDYEFCLRAKSFGFPVYLLFPPQILVNRLHLGSKQKSLIWRGYYHSRNHILILKKYYSFDRLAGYINRHSKIILHALIFGPYRFQKVKYRLLGIWDGINDISGKTVDPKNFN